MGRLSHQESQEQGLQQRLLDEQFAVLRRTAAEAERILQDAVGKLDDPLHLRCTSSPGGTAFPALSAGWGSPTPREVRLRPSPLLPVLADYLVSRAQAALDTVSTLEKGHTQYLACRSGECRGPGLSRQRPAVAGCWLSWPRCLLPLGGFPQQAPHLKLQVLSPPIRAHLGALSYRPGSQTWVCFLLRSFLAS